MIYTTSFKYIPQYEESSRNQHGKRYKKIDDKQVTVLMIATDGIDSVKELRDLIIIGCELGVPVQYDFSSDPQRAFIEIISVLSL